MIINTTIIDVIIWQIITQVIVCLMRLLPSGRILVMSLQTVPSTTQRSRNEKRRILGFPNHEIRGQTVILRGEGEGGI